MDDKEIARRRKRVLRIAYVSFGLVLLLIGVAIFFTIRENKKFREEGIRVKARINSMYEEGNSKSRTYKMDISMFTKGKENEVAKPDTASKSESEKKWDEILSGLTINTNIGNYVSTTIHVSSDAYNKYNPGDEVEVVYLKDDSTNVKLWSDVE